MALASVLSVFPHLSGKDLIRLAKACAKQPPGLLNGLGVADFNCMTKEEGGRRRLITRAELDALITDENMTAVYARAAAMRQRNAMALAAQATQEAQKSAYADGTEKMTFTPLPRFDKDGKRIVP